MSDIIYTYHDYHKPVLTDGEYTVSVDQQLQLSDTAKTNQTYNTPDLTFYVEGPKFVLPSGLIHTCYPPTGGKGDYQADLPTISFNRNTLPWERLPTIHEASNNSAGWLFLMLVDSSEASKVVEHNNAPLTDIATDLQLGTDLSAYPKNINYLTVKSSLSYLWPANINTLQYLNFTRTKTQDGKTSAEHSILLSQRLPKPGSNSTMYVVSMENCYKDQPDGSFQGFKNKAGDYVFPYLYKWQFHTFNDTLYAVNDKLIGKYPDLAALNGDLYTGTKAFKTALASTKEKDNAQVIKAAKLPGTTFHEILQNLHDGFAPLNLPLTSAAAMASSGSVNLDYYKVDRKRATLSAINKAWYRSPLAAQEISMPTGFGSALTEVEHAEQLLLGDAASAVDCTYATAWELGRLTALSDMTFSETLFKWKNQTATAIKQAQIAQNSQYPNVTHLPFANRKADASIPKSLLKQFQAWQKLEGIPFNHLLPDSNLLPSESLRYFCLDANWINAFTQGAFSIGHTLEIDWSSYLDSLMMPKNSVYGFVLRSLAVDGWPDYLVDILSHNAPVSVVNTIQIDKDTRLVLTKGSFDTLRFHLHHGTVHPGFLLEEGVNGGAEQWTKTMSFSETAITWTPGSSNHYVMDVQQFNGASAALKDKSITPLTVSQFAVQMLQLPARVEFNIATPEPSVKKVKS